jgi:hypothetical protein
MPLLLLADARESATLVEKTKWYLYDGEMTEENIVQFLEDWKAGKVPRFYKSQKIDQVTTIRDCYETTGHYWLENIA